MADWIRMLMMSGVSWGMGVLDWGGDRRRGRDSYGVNLGHPIVTIGELSKCYGPVSICLSITSWYCVEKLNGSNSFPVYRCSVGWSSYIMLGGISSQSVKFIKYTLAAKSWIDTYWNNRKMLRLKVSSEIRPFPWNLLTKSEIRKSRHATRHKCCQFCSTDGRRQLITLSVHLCVQHTDVSQRVAWVRR